MTNESKCPKFSAEVRERAVRMVFEHRTEHTSQWAAIVSIAAKIGCTAQTLSNWVRQAERDQGKRPGTTTDDRERIKALEREVRELRQANEILRKASAYFAQAELDRRWKPCSTSSMRTETTTGSSRSAESWRSPRQLTTRMPAAARNRRRHRRASSVTSS